MPMATYTTGWIPPSDVFRVECPNCGTGYVIRMKNEVWRDFECAKTDCRWTGEVRVLLDERPAFEYRLPDGTPMEVIE